MNITRILFLLLCITILNHNTIKAFSWKNIYTSFIPQKPHKEIIFEEYALKNGTLLIKNKRGDILVKTGTDSDKIFLKAIKKSADPLDLPKICFSKFTADNTLTLESKYDEKIMKGSLDFELIVPPSVAVNIATHEGNISAKNVHNPIMLTTSYGNIEIIQAHNTIKALCHKKGSIKIDQPMATVNAYTNIGNITIYDAHASIFATADHGTIESHSTLVPSTSIIKVSTISGAINVYLPPDVNAQLFAETKFGTITSQQTVTVNAFATQLNNAAWKRFKKEIEGTLGSGEAQIKLSSVNSNIKLLHEKRA